MKGYQPGVGFQETAGLVNFPISLASEAIMVYAE